jgi:hypothetical protein
MVIMSFSLAWLSKIVPWTIDESLALAQKQAQF